MPEPIIQFKALNYKVGKEHTGKLRLHAFDMNSNISMRVLEIRGLTTLGQGIQKQRLRIHFDDIDNLIEALEYIKAGPIGRMALDMARKRKLTPTE